MMAKSEVLLKNPDIEQLASEMMDEISSKSMWNEVCRKIGVVVYL